MREMHGLLIIENDAISARATNVNGDDIASSAIFGQSVPLFAFPRPLARTSPRRNSLPRPYSALPSSSLQAMRKGR